MSGCTFDPTRDYSCYAIPSAANAACPAGVAPQGSRVVRCRPLRAVQQRRRSAGRPLYRFGRRAQGRVVHLQASERRRVCERGLAPATPRGLARLGAGCDPGHRWTCRWQGSASPPALSTVAKGGACGPADQQFCYKRVRSREHRREVGDVHDRPAPTPRCRAARFDPTQRLLLLQDPGRCQRRLSVGRRAPDGSGVRPSRPARSATASRASSAVSISDAAGAPKIGWCVCQPGATGMTTWSCASDTAWPCPLGAGC